MTGQQLKNSILQMAVQGKLVPQDPNDEPASVLLERIRAEKEALIKAGKIKKEKNPSVIFRGADNLPYKNDTPYDIPDSWVWLKHNDLFEISGGSQPPKSKFKSEPQDGYVRLYQIRDYGEKPVPVYIPISTASKISSKGDILLARYGASLGKVFWAEDGAYNVAMAKIIPLYACLKDFIDSEYLYYYYHTDLYRSVIFGNSRSAQAGFNKEDLENMWFPLPPLTEQKRIVTKIKQVVPFIDEYEKARDILSEWNDNFSTFLKKSILQEAVQGKLVPQDENDEPASVLLERIRAEKQALIKAGKIKKDKNESVIFRRDNSHYEKRGSEVVCIDDEIPFEIPDSWKWVRLNDIVNFIGGYAYKSETFINHSDYQVLRLGNVKNDEIKASAKPVYITDKLAKETSAFKCKLNDILVTMTGTRLKRDYFYTARIEQESFNYYVNQRVGCLRCYESEVSLWLINILKSDFVLNQVFQYETGTANQGNLGSENILKTLIPIPPLNEQKRIAQHITRIFEKLLQLS